MFSCVILLRCHGAGGRVDLETSLKSIVFFVGESVCAPFCAPLQNPDRRCKLQTKPCRTNNAKQTLEQHETSSEEHQEMLQNGSLEGVLGGPGAAWGALGHKIGAKRLPKSALEASGHPQNAPGEPPDPPRSEKLLDFRVVPGWYPETLGRAPGSFF